MSIPKNIAGVIYDVDDTLLDNQRGRDPLNNLHQVARLSALHEIATDLGGEYVQLLDVLPQENYDSFILSPVHTVEGAFLTLLKNRKLITDSADFAHPIIRRLITLKNEAYTKLLETEGDEVPGATSFVRDFAKTFNIENKNAIASMATARDIKSFLSKYELTYLFPGERIIDIAKVTSPKPDPEVFDVAFRSLCLDESERPRVIAFEDDPRGIVSARNAGLYVCAITTRYSRQQIEEAKVHPDYIAASFAEFRLHFSL